MEALVPAELDELLVQRDGHLRPCGGQELGTAALFAAAVQRELGDDEQLALHVLQAAVHLAVFVLEDPETGELVRQLDGLGLGVLMGHAQQDEEALPDLAVYLAVDSDGCVLHAGQYCSHGICSFSRFRGVCGRGAEC